MSSKLVPARAKKTILVRPPTPGHFNVGKQVDGSRITGPTLNRQGAGGEMLTGRNKRIVFFARAGNQIRIVFFARGTRKTKTLAVAVGSAYGGGWRWMSVTVIIKELRILAITVDVDAGITGEGGEWERPRR